MTEQINPLWKVVKLTLWQVIVLCGSCGVGVFYFVLLLLNVQWICDPRDATATADLSSTRMGSFRWSPNSQTQAWDRRFERAFWQSHCFTKMGSGVDSINSVMPTRNSHMVSDSGIVGATQYGETVRLPKSSLKPSVPWLSLWGFL